MTEEESKITNTKTKTLDEKVKDTIAVTAVPMKDKSRLDEYDSLVGSIKSKATNIFVRVSSIMAIGLIVTGLLFILAEKVTGRPLRAELFGNRTYVKMYEEASNVVKSGLTFLNADIASYDENYVKDLKHTAKIDGEKGKFHLYEVSIPVTIHFPITKSKKYLLKIIVYRDNNDERRKKSGHDFWNTKMWVVYDEFPQLKKAYDEVIFGILDEASANYEKNDGYYEGCNTNDDSYGSYFLYYFGNILGFETMTETEPNYEVLMAFINIIIDSDNEVLYKSLYPNLFPDNSSYYNYDDEYYDYYYDEYEDYY